MSIRCRQRWLQIDRGNVRNRVYRSYASPAAAIAQAHPGFAASGAQSYKPTAPEPSQTRVGARSPARGKLDVTVKGKMAIFDVNFLNQVYFGLSTTSGYNKVVTNEQHTINANVTTATNIPLVQDFGVIYYATGAAFTKVANVASITANGQYVVNLTSGVYTFNGGDNASVVLLSYTYNVNAGASVVISEQLMGYAPEVQLFLFNNFRNKYLALQLNDVTLGSISIPTKLEDFWIADFDGSANADASGNLGIWMSDLS